MKLGMTPIKVTRGFLTDPSKVSRAIENALNAAALGVKADYGVVTQTWDTKVRFVIKSGAGTRTITTTSDIFGYVDLGTRPHLIRARRKPRLAFRGGYSAKTTPNTIGSQQGGSSGDWRFAKTVKHPGTKARNFSKVIAKKWNKELAVITQRAIDSEV